MHRKTFIKASCLACTSLSFLGTILESCSSVRYTTGQLNENGMTVALKQFERVQKGKPAHRSYIIVKHDDLQYPICVYRIDENKYNALYLSCSHQGAELQVSGDQLTCPAHGSAFDKYGKVTNGPASSPLRNFPVSIANDQLFIDLRKQS